MRYSDEISIVNINRFLLGLLGSQELVQNWWNSKNEAFNMNTPLEIWCLPDGKEQVFNYVMYFSMK